MLETQLSQQLENLIRLQEILEEEKRCLKEKDFKAFNDTLFNKQKILQAVTSLDKKLTTANSLHAINESAELTALKNTLEAHLHDCQKINTINGKLVALSMKSNKHLMQVITQATGKNSVTYNQKGLLHGGQLLGENIKA